MKFKGDAIVITGTETQRTPFGAFSTSYSFAGIAQSIGALAAAQPLGAELRFSQKDAVSGLDVTYPPDTFVDKWELDRENVDKDLMFNPNFRGMTAGARREIRRWRSDPTGDDLDLTKGNGGSDTPLMQQIQDLVLSGVEAYQVSTIVLKRTRSMSVNLAPIMVLTEQTQFFSTARLIANENVDTDQTGTLPVAPYAAPANTQWGWLQRNQNRSYISRGFMEEHTDWVFGAISTALYAYVA